MDKLISTEGVESAIDFQVDVNTKKIPKTVQRLNAWEYLERSMQRLMSGWGSQFLAWDDKVAICRHVHDQAECVQKLRVRVKEFTGGVPGNSVSPDLERLVNTVLMAPGIEDAIDGIYQVLLTGITKNYLDYIEHAHPIHDAPTIEVLGDIVAIKDQHRKWLRDYRRRNPHTTNLEYQNSIELQLSQLNRMIIPVQRTEKAPSPVGVNTDFRLSEIQTPNNWNAKRDILPYVCADFSESVEARRLFWCVGYMRELHLSLDQLQWLYDSPFMPWEYHYDLSRHLWDESRHGDSGYSRLKDFGITIEEVGFIGNICSDEIPRVLEVEKISETHVKPLTPAELYEKTFFIGLVAENGHFRVKNESYEDFRDGGDMESAEMMLFDIIDETSHVKYARRWLPVMAKNAGIDSDDFEARAKGLRKRMQDGENRLVEAWQKSLPRNTQDSTYALYQELLERMRKIKPLTNAKTCPPRSNKPM